MQEQYFLKDIKWLTIKTTDKEKGTTIIKMLPFFVSSNGKTAKDISTGKNYESKRTYSFELDILEQIGKDYNYKFSSFEYGKKAINIIKNNVEFHAGDMTFLTLCKMKDYSEQVQQQGCLSQKELIEMGDNASRSENEVTKHIHKIKTEDLIRANNYRLSLSKKCDREM